MSLDFIPPSSRSRHPIFAASTPIRLSRHVSTMGALDIARSTADSNESRSNSSSKHSSASASVSNSPQISRDSSPIRPPPPRTGSALSRSSISAPRSRKNSYQDQSPSRPSRPSVPSPAAIQRSLSSGTTPTLLPVAQDHANVKQPQKSPLQVEQVNSPRWPISPRLRSPPPIQQGKPNLVPPTKTQDTPPSINVQRASPSPQLEAINLVSDSETDDSQPQSGMRTPARGPGASTLETVQEVSLPNSPMHGVGSALEQVTESLLSEAAARGDQAEVNTGRSRTRPSLTPTPNESGSENGGSSYRRSGSVAPPPLLSRQSSSNTVKLNGGKGKSSDGLIQQTTVEIETVPSVPQVSLAPTPSTQGSQASLRTKPSTETIRPKKEKKEKKKPRKQASVPAGTASSKADIFEAKIASAIDETNTSDSDETFVYDSNPPDTDRRKGRWHSRTPSATSMMSQADRAGMRSIHAVMETPGPSMATVKKGMKFVNTFNSNLGDPSTGEEDGHGTGRSAASAMRGTGRHAHVNNWRRNNGTHASLIFDSDSGHPSLARQFLHGSASRNSSAGPPSPRPEARRAPRAKRSMQMISGIDLDDSSRADDERAPLLNASIRSSASRRSQARRHNPRHLESQTYRANPSILTRFASCLVLAIMVILVVSGAIGFMFATSQPLTEIELVTIQNVVASEQELMLDMTVKAHNPNIVVVSIESADIEVFAKSPHAGTDSEWWKYPHGPPEEDDFMAQGRQTNEVETLDDPLEDPPKDEPPQEDNSPNMRLGAILKFDSPLVFEGSFFHGGISKSTGSVRLQKPGNTTTGGTERWERILQDEFTLILKGVLKYSLPLSQRIRSVAVTGKTLVKPNSASDPTLRPNGTDVTTNV